MKSRRAVGPDYENSQIEGITVMGKHTMEGITITYNEIKHFVLISALKEGRHD